MTFQPSCCSNRPAGEGFTLIELLVVLAIIGAIASLVGPRMLRAYDSVRISAEEQRLKDVLEFIKTRAFLRQTPYTVHLRGNSFRVKGQNTVVKFEYIHFQESKITFNANGFSSVKGLYYRVGDQKRILDIP